MGGWSKSHFLGIFIYLIKRKMLLMYIRIFPVQKKFKRSPSEYCYYSSILIQFIAEIPTLDFGVTDNLKQ